MNENSKSSMRLVIWFVNGSSTCSTSMNSPLVMYWTAESFQDRGQEKRTRVQGGRLSLKGTFRHNTNKYIL